MSQNRGTIFIFLLNFFLRIKIIFVTKFPNSKQLISKTRIQWTIGLQFFYIKKRKKILKTGNFYEFLDYLLIPIPKQIWVAIIKIFLRHIQISDRFIDIIVI